MTTSLQEYFYNTYPDLFREHTLPPEESSMHWGITCEDGWFKILDEVCSNIVQYVDSFNSTVQYWKDREKKETIVDSPVKYTHFLKPVVFKQIKEKYGALVIYHSGGDDWVQGVISFAHSLSATTCEKCGTMNETVGKTTDGHIQTLCHDCASKEHRVLAPNVWYNMKYDPTKKEMIFDDGKKSSWQLTDKNVKLTELLAKTHNSKVCEKTNKTQKEEPYDDDPGIGYYRG